MSVVVVGVDHLHTAFDLVERVALSDAEQGKFLAELRTDPNLSEVAVISTCLRTEVYAVVDRFHEGVTSLCTALAERAEMSAERFEEEATILFDRGVATHLFSVASGLFSAVPGESEVLGQVRRAGERASEEGADGPVLSTLFRHAVDTGRKVRDETAIGRGSLSFSHAALELATERSGGSLAGRSVVLVGAGQLGESMAQALAGLPEADRPRGLTIVNRTPERADELATTTTATAGLEAGTAAFEDLGAVLQAAEVLIVAAEADEPFVDAGLVGDRAGRPLLVVDLGVPRTVTAELREAGAVTVVDVSDMSTRVNEALLARRGEVAAAEDVITREVARYEAAVRARGAAPVVTALRDRVEGIRLAELERRRGELGDLTAEQLERVDELTRSILNKVMHEPTVTLRESGGTPRGQRLVEALRSLFDL